MSLPETRASTKSSQITTDGKISKTASYYAAFVALGLVTAALGPTLPGLAEHTQTRLSEISFLFAAQAFGLLVGSFFGGRLYDRVKGHPLMAAVIVAMAITMFLTPLMSLLWLLTIVVLIMGFAMGAIDVGGNTLIVWVHRRQVGPYMNGLHFFFGVGAFLSPIIIAQAMLISGDITWAYWILALIILPVSLWLLWLASPPSRSVAADGLTDDNANPLLITLIALFFFLFVGAEISFGGWIFTYATSLNLADAAVAAYLTSAYWGALTVGRLVAIPLAARFKPSMLLFGSVTGAVISLVILLLWSGSIAAMWIGVVGTGFSLASLFPNTLSMAERRLMITGQTTAWFLVGADAGGMTVPWLIGQFFESVGPRVVMTIILLDLIMALAILAVLIVYSNRTEPVEVSGSI